jgi:hypothetical protein
MITGLTNHCYIETSLNIIIKLLKGITCLFFREKKLLLRNEDRS